MNRSLRLRLRPFAGAGLLTFAFVAPSFAASWELVPLPFSRANVTSMAVAPSQAGRVYIGASGIGVYRTDDRGTTWTAANGRMPLDSVVDVLVVSPVNANRVWAVMHAPSIGFGSVWRSTDGGANWTGSAGIPGQVIKDLIVVSTNPSILLGSINEWEPSTVYRSTDDGASWNPAGLGFSEKVIDLESHPSDPTVILAATQYGIARSTDSGTTWAMGQPYQWFRHVVMAPSEASIVYAAEHLDGKLYKSTNGGISFFPIEAPFGFEHIDGIAVHPMLPDQLMVAGSGYQSGTDCEALNSFIRVEETTDGGETWSMSYSMCPASAGSTPLAYDPTDANHVYLEHSGFLHSASGGAPGTWVLEVDGIANYGVRTIEGDLAGSYYVGGSPDLYRSIGDLSTWVHVSSTLGTSFRFEVNFTNSTRMSDVGTYPDGENLNRPFFHQSTNGGVTWSNVGGLPPGIPDNTSIGGAYTNHGDGSVVYASGYPKLYRSVDAGQNFTLVNSSLQQGLRDLVMDPLDMNRIFGVFSLSPRVQLSTDGGITFQPRVSGLPSASIKTLFMRRSDPDYLVVVYENGEVWETFDAGIAWSLRFDLDVPPFHSVSGADWDEASGHVFLAVDNHGGVVTSHPLYDPSSIPTASVSTVHWDPAQSTLLAGTSQAGLWQQTIPSLVDAPLLVDAAAFALEVAPNPARDATSVRFAVPSGGAQVTADVFDASGRRIRRLVDAALPEGMRQLVWDGAADSGERASAGVYFVRVRAGSEESTARIVRLR